MADAATPSKPVGSAVQPCPNCNGPCAGQGLDNKAARDAYTKKMKGLQKEWPGLTPKKRESRLEDIVNSTLSPDSPKVKLGGASDLTGNARYTGDDHSISIKNSTLGNSKLSDEQFRRMSSDLYHETRHSEQFTAMARMRAGDGLSADQIQDEMEIPPEVAEYGAANPLPPNSDMSNCVRPMHTALIDKEGRKKTDSIMAEFRKKADRLNDVEKRLGQSEERMDLMNQLAKSKDGKLSPDEFMQFENTKFEMQTLEKNRQAAKDAFDKAKVGYENLPHEADAYSVGNQIESGW